ncbi:MAG: hypothetical protein ACRD0X_00245 [Thermoanaerobaculia bacterium]
MGGSLAAGPAAAQLVLDGEEQLPFDAPESWAMKYFASVALPSGLGSPEPLPAGRVELVLEGANVPRLSEEERRVGFDGTKVEDLNRSEVFGRPRVVVGLGARWSLEASYLPPLELSGVEPEIFSLAAGRPVWERGRARLGLRVAGQYGTFEGDFTCSADEIASGSNPFDCEAPSTDTSTARSLSVEISGARRLGRAEGWEAYGALIATHMNLDFEVDARWSGFVDHTRLHTDGETVALAAGVGYRLAERWRGGLEVFWTRLDVVRPPATSTEHDDLVNLRAALRYRLR